MNKSWVGPSVAGLIMVGVALILAFNFQPDRPNGKSTPPPVEDDKGSKGSANSAVGDPPREYPIGDPTERNHLQVKAVWLAGVIMEGMPPTAPGSPEVIHLEADVRSLGDNPNGFAKDEFIPYLLVKYTILPASGGSAIDQGDLIPMIASDGLHYGANISKPKAGSYKLIYDIQPPSKGGLGRHVGNGGVAGWWEPFRAEFEWTVEPEGPKVAGGS